MFVGVVRKVRAELGSVWSGVCVRGCKNGTKLKSLSVSVCVFGIVRTVQSLAVCVQDF